MLRNLSLIPFGLGILLAVVALASILTTSTEAEFFELNPTLIFNSTAIAAMSGASFLCAIFLLLLDFVTNYQASE